MLQGNKNKLKFKRVNKRKNYHSYIDNALALINSFASGDTYIQHKTDITDGVSGLNEALTALAETGIAMIYDDVHMVLANGNFVLAFSEGTYGDDSTSY